MPDVEYTSRERLAASIEVHLRQEIPRPTRGDDLTASIDSALQDESCRNERTVAYLRIIALVALLVPFAIFGGLNELDILAPRALAALLWLATSIAVAVALRRGWYRPWIRRALPSADALMLVIAGVSLGAGDGATPNAAVGFAALAGLGVLLAVSGAARLTRSAVYYSTTVAALAIAAVYVAMVGGAPMYAAIAVVPVLLAGMLGLAITQLARRLVMTKVGHLAMRRLYGEAREVIDAREEVLRIVAHDLRNPLNTIAMTTQLLLELEASEQQRKERLTVIRRAGERMNRLINDLLSVSIIEAGRLTVAPRAVSVATLLGDATEMLRPLATAKSIQLDVSAEPDLPDVHADAQRILQVLSNLIGNAIKFTPDRGRITLSATREGSKVRIAVTDTGPGIAPEQLANIFGRFWQANRADARGIGLGLSIAKGIVEAHGEELRVSSTVGEGSEFSFTVRSA